MQRQDILDEQGLDKERFFLIMEYMKGNISRSEIVKLFGEEVVEDINFIMEKTKSDLNEARKLAKKRE